MVIFFNASPKFERDEIRLPLPADDAAWDATSSSEVSGTALSLEIKCWLPSGVDVALGESAGLATQAISR